MTPGWLEGADAALPGAVGAALDPDTGRCDLDPHRPLACRTMGPPVRLAGEDLPPCRLCFEGARPEEVEAGRHPSSRCASHSRR